jgi:hypothetical protein
VKWEINFHKHQHFPVYACVTQTFWGVQEKRKVAIPKNLFLISLCNNTFQLCDDDSGGEKWEHIKIMEIKNDIMFDVFETV